MDDDQIDWHRSLLMRIRAIGVGAVVALSWFTIPVCAVAQGWNPKPGWKDSYAVDGRCYCDSRNYDHGLGSKTAETPLGQKNVVEICNDIRDALGPGPVAGRIPFNDIQCGHGPANDARDEIGCPGRVDIGPAGCSVKGPKWDLQAVYGDHLANDERGGKTATDANAGAGGSTVDGETITTDPCTIVTESDASLREAIAQFATRCAERARRDCDRVSGNRWMCSTNAIDPNGSVPGVARRSGSAVVSTGAWASAESKSPEITRAQGSNRRIGRIRTRDLVSLHYDNCPDRDDGHALVAGRAVVAVSGLSRVIVVNGTCGDGIRDRYQRASEDVVQAVWADAWLDYHNRGGEAVESAAARWAAVLEEGGDVWVAEGGPSDFTVRVLQRLEQRFPSLDRKRIHVVQHSRGFNQRHTSHGNLAYLQKVADYQLIGDGNQPNNGTADLNRKSSYFVRLAYESEFSRAWGTAFDYLDPQRKLDFSDTVELLYIIDDTTTRTVDDFAHRYLR